MASRLGPQQRDPAGREWRGQVERRLAAVGDDGGEQVGLVGRLGVDDVAHALGVERLEVEAGRGVEVGRHGLRVRIDHHRAPARATERVGGLDGAVVELDPLPDPDRAGADDEGRRPGDGRRFRRRSGGRVRRVEVGRLGRELRGAGVDHREAGTQPEDEPRGPDLPRRRAGQVGQLAIPEAGTLDRGQELRGGRVGRVRQTRPGGRGLRLERDVAAHLGQEPGGDPGRPRR